MQLGVRGGTGGCTLCAYGGEVCTRRRRPAGRPKIAAELAASLKTDRKINCCGLPSLSRATLSKLSWELNKHTAWNCPGLCRPSACGGTKVQTRWLSLTRMAKTRS